MTASDEEDQNAVTRREYTAEDEDRQPGSQRFSINSLLEEPHLTEEKLSQSHQRRTSDTHVGSRCLDEPSPTLPFPASRHHWWAGGILSWRPWTFWRPRRREVTIAFTPPAKPQASDLGRARPPELGFARKRAFHPRPLKQGSCSCTGVKLVGLCGKRAQPGEGSREVQGDKDRAITEKKGRKKTKRNGRNGPACQERNHHQLTQTALQARGGEGRRQSISACIRLLVLIEALLPFRLFLLVVVGR
jgi:hypothetical protein